MSRVSFSEAFIHGGNLKWKVTVSDFSNGILTDKTLDGNGYQSRYIKFFFFFYSTAPLLLHSHDASLQAGARCFSEHLFPSQTNKLGLNGPSREALRSHQVMIHILFL